MPDTATEIYRLREEIHKWRMEDMHRAHTLDLRVQKLEWGREDSKRSREHLHKRLKSIEDQYSRFLYLGWSVAAVIAAALFKVFFPSLAGLF